MIQPRGVASGIRGRNDARAPDPGFSAAQYERLALVYTIASVRAGRWLIPAFHAAIDSGIRGGHDDPQNFDLEAFAASLERLVRRLMQGPAIASITRENGTAAAPVAAITTIVETPTPVAAPAAIVEARGPAAAEPQAAVVSAAAVAAAVTTTAETPVPLPRPHPSQSAAHNGSSWNGSGWRGNNGQYWNSRWQNHRVKNTGQRWTYQPSRTWKQSSRYAVSRWHQPKWSRYSAPKWKSRPARYARR